jgi:excinuclease ABC subunit A
MFTEINACAKYYDIDLDMPIEKMPKDKLDIILYGSPDIMDFKYYSKAGNTRTKTDFFEGIITNLERRYLETTAGWIREWIEGFMIEMECPVCHGKRLKDNILSVYINKKNIYDMTAMSIEELYNFMKSLKLTKEQAQISELLVKEICNRLEFLNNVGLGYITLERAAGTLSGGEAQRIRLATQIGSKLSGVLYVLDEPSIGLHQRDNAKLIESMKEMRDLGNTLIVVEHDIDTMLAADYLVDIGPGAGNDGGYVMAAGTPEEVMKNPNSLTGKYLTGKEKIEVPKKRRKGNGLYLEVKGAKEHN